MSDLTYDRQMSLLAARLDETSRSIHVRAMHVAAALTGCEWDGDAARAFRHAAGDLLATMRLASTRLESAATAVRQHGATAQDRYDEHARTVARDVQERIDDLKELGKRVRDALDGDR